MVLLKTVKYNVHCKNGPKGIYSLAVIIVLRSITVFISSIYNYNINRNPSFCLSYDIPVQEVTYTGKIF